MSQWRAYGVPGSVYSIGFNVKNLIKSITPHSFELHKCEYYDSQDYRVHIEKFIEDFLFKVKDDKKLLPEFIFVFTSLAARMKHDCFKEEDEYRVVSIKPLTYNNERFNFRPGKSIFIPYYSIPLDLQSTIVNLCVGPCQHPALAEDTLFGLAYKYGLINKKNDLVNIEIDVSDIPYREI